VGNDWEELVLGVADGLGNPVFDLGDLAEFDLPVDVWKTRADDIGGIAEAGELLAATDTGVAEGFAEFVAPHAFSAGAFRAGVHW
jgi:hypothetical protein